jgi:hypothetical protein
MRALRSHQSGLAQNEMSILKKIKSEAFVDYLEALAEVRPLSTQEIELKSQSNTEIARIL